MLKLVWSLRQCHDMALASFSAPDIIQREGVAAWLCVRISMPLLSEINNGSCSICPFSTFQQNSICMGIFFDTQHHRMCEALAGPPGAVDSSIQL